MPPRAAAATAPPERVRRPVSCFGGFTPVLQGVRRRARRASRLAAESIGCGEQCLTDTLVASGHCAQGAPSFAMLSRSRKCRRSTTAQSRWGSQPLCTTRGRAHPWHPASDAIPAANACSCPNSAPAPTPAPAPAPTPAPSVSPACIAACNAACPGLQGDGSGGVPNATASTKPFQPCRAPVQGNRASVLRDSREHMYCTTSICYLV